MLDGEHALLKAVGRVAGQNRHFGLTEHVAGVEFFGDDMNRTPADLIASLDGAGMGVEPSIIR
jgi:hypothetical protein